MNQSLSVLGVDTNAELLSLARSECEKQALGGRMRFINEDCYSLSFSDGLFDMAGCCTVLLHLAEPARALAEMARVTTPAGVVFAIEPDNFASFPAGWDSAGEPDGTDYAWAVRRIEYARTLYEGKLRLGQGDSATGRRLPHVFAQAGLDVFLFRKSDRMIFLAPPYDTDEKRTLAENLSVTLSEEQCRKFLPQLRLEYAAGGGTDVSFDSFWKERLARQNAALARLAEEKLTWVANQTICVCAGRKRDQKSVNYM